VVVVGVAHSMFVSHVHSSTVASPSFFLFFFVTSVLFLFLPTCVCVFGPMCRVCVYAWAVLSLWCSLDTEIEDDFSTTFPFSVPGEEQTGTKKRTHKS
jgi:hypothetical protein